MFRQHGFCCVNTLLQNYCCDGKETCPTLLGSVDTNRDHNRVVLPAYIHRPYPVEVSVDQRNVVVRDDAVTQGGETLVNPLDHDGVRQRISQVLQFLVCGGVGYEQAALVSWQMVPRIREEHGRGGREAYRYSKIYNTAVQDRVLLLAVVFTLKALFPLYINGHPARPIFVVRMICTDDSSSSSTYEERDTSPRVTTRCIPSKSFFLEVYGSLAL